MYGPPLMEHAAQYGRLTMLPLLSTITGMSTSVCCSDQFLLQYRPMLSLSAIANITVMMSVCSLIGIRISCLKQEKKCRLPQQFLEWEWCCCGPVSCTVLFCYVQNWYTKIVRECLQPMWGLKWVWYQEILSWRQHLSADRPWPNFLSIAVRYGHVPVVAWFCKNGQPATMAVLRQALWGAELPMVKYLMRDGALNDSTATDYSLLCESWARQTESCNPGNDIICIRRSYRRILIRNKYQEDIENSNRNLLSGPAEMVSAEEDPFWHSLYQERRRIAPQRLSRYISC